MDEEKEEEMVEKDYPMDLGTNKHFGLDKASAIRRSLFAISVLSIILPGCIPFSSQSNPIVITMKSVHSTMWKKTFTKFYCNGQNAAAYMVNDDGTHPSFTVLQFNGDIDLSIGIDDWNGDGKLDSIVFLYGAYIIDIFVSSDCINWSRAPAPLIDKLRRKSGDITEKYGQYFDFDHPHRR